MLQSLRPPSHSPMLPYEADHETEPSPEAIALALQLAVWDGDVLIPMPVVG